MRACEVLGPGFHAQPARVPLGFSLTRKWRGWEKGAGGERSRVRRNGAHCSGESPRSQRHRLPEGLAESFGYAKSFSALGRGGGCCDRRRRRCDFTGTGPCSEITFEYPHGISSR